MCKITETLRYLISHFLSCTKQKLEEYVMLYGSRMCYGNMKNENIELLWEIEKSSLKKQIFQLGHGGCGEVRLGGMEVS